MQDLLLSVGILSRMSAELVETWSINDRINRYLLDAIAQGALVTKPAKGRSIAEMFAHLHNVRIDWLKSGDPSLLTGLAKLEKDGLARELLAEALEASAVAIGELVARGLEAGRIKGFKPHPTAFVAYMCAHDSYHRAEAAMVASTLGYPLDKKTSFGMWEWGVR